MISPWFNKFTSIDDADVDEAKKISVKARLTKLAERSGFPETEIVVIDHSKRSGHSNSAFIGTWRSKRIILYDTLFSEKFTDDQIEAVCAHEIGHYKLNHTNKLFLVGIGNLCLMFGTFALFINNHSMLISYGFDHESNFVSLMVFFKAYELVSFLSNTAMTVLKRKIEFEADQYAANQSDEMKKALGEALLKMTSENKSCMNPDPWYSAVYCNHPTL